MTTRCVFETEFRIASRSSGLIERKSSTSALISSSLERLRRGQRERHRLRITNDRDVAAFALQFRFAQRNQQLVSAGSIIPFEL